MSIARPIYYVSMHAKNIYVKENTRTPARRQRDSSSFNRSRALSSASDLAARSPPAAAVMLVVTLAEAAVTSVGESEEEAIG